MPQKYRFKTKPYAHQVRALRQLIKNGYGGELFMEPRTGKTKTAIDYASMLATKRKIDKVVIVCPARVMHVWIQQFAIHCPLVFHTTIWDKVARRRKVGHKFVGNPPPAVSSMYDLEVVIVNYDAFSTPGRRTASGRRSKASGRFKNRQMLRNWMHSTDTGTLMILDESHRIANPSGSAATMIVTMQPDAKYRLILTGTPTTKAKKAHDLQMQFRFSDPTRFADIPTADDFKNMFGRWIHDNGYPQWIGAKNPQLLKTRIHKSAVVVRREDCFDLPPRQDIIKQIPLTSSAQVYDDMAAKMVAQLIHARETHTVEATIKLVQGLRLRQITGGVATTDEGKLIRIGREKLIALHDELEAANEHEEKIVIAAQFRADLSAIEAMCRREFKMQTYVLKGGIKLDQSSRDIRDFERHEGPAAFVVQPQSGSEGIDLSSAAHMVWYSLTPSWVKYTQMCDRIALSRTSTSFTYLLAKDTVDEVLYETLQEDGEMAKRILEKPELFLRNQAQMAAVEDALAILRY